MANEDQKKFTCEIEKEVYSSDNFKIYAADIDTKEYPNIKLNQYGNVTLVGDVHNLAPGVPYYVTAIEKDNKKFGKQYEITNIRRDKPQNKTQTRKFLQEILTNDQAAVLMRTYPDIVDRVMSGNTSDIDLNKTKGIKQKTFDKIKNKIIENFQLVEVVDIYGGYGITFTMLKKLFESYTSIQVMKRELRNDPYRSLCKLSGVSFKKADGIIRSIPKEVLGIDYDITNSRSRMSACVYFILTENENEGHTNMNIRDLRKQCEELASESLKHFVDVINNENWVHFSKATMLVSRKSTYETEIYVAEKIKELVSQPNDLRLDYEQYRETSEGSLTDQQLQALENLSKYNLSLLLGFGGSGKSFTTTNIINMLQDSELTFELMAPTGKASDVLASYSGVHASTIHRGLGYNPSQGWYYNEEQKLPSDVVIIDEMGMIDIFLMKRLLEAIDTSKTKLLFIGDPAQLPSVSCGNVAYDMIHSNIVPKTELTKIFRYDEGGLYNVATEVRNGKNYIKEEPGKMVYNFGVAKDYSLLTLPQSQMIQSAINLYSKIVKDGCSIEDVVILTHHNKGEFGTKEINRKIQEVINPIEKGKKWIQKGEHKFIEGDRVMQTINNYKAKDKHGNETQVFNGNMGMVIEIGWNNMIVDFGTTTVEYEKDQLNQLLLGYCVTIHKFQGSACKNVILVTPDAHTFFMNRNLLYTGITRTKEKCFHFSSTKLINSSLRKSISMSRNTYLKGLLTGKLN